MLAIIFVVINATYRLSVDHTLPLPCCPTSSQRHCFLYICASICYIFISFPMHTLSSFVDIDVMTVSKSVSFDKQPQQGAGQLVHL